MQAGGGKGAHAASRGGGGEGPSVREVLVVFRWQRVGAGWHGCRHITSLVPASSPALWSRVSALQL
ncbi:hypothetical protein ppKF707_2710 [Metapseudomonas furukawaii]|uniref:Uncharacterized protein n=1 Tax=Metapseudomonas furukawaii TaxID=1149133 RepID=A0AAD1C119_METFU|nr:hypothetical protein ppKF707_2710 [Pseudomonas furukawaii]BAU74855.1 hypothetical protein KF707C_31670 [Pseudomonas furukawaii]